MSPEWIIGRYHFPGCVGVEDYSSYNIRNAFSGREELVSVWDV